jgi:hypothetical protein
MLYGVKHWAVRKAVLPALYALSKLVAAGLERYAPGNEAYDIFSRHGYHLLKKHYFLPIPDRAELGDDFWEGQSELVGIEMNEAGALALLRDVFPPYVAEFDRLFPLHPTDDPQQFYLINGNFMAVDAHVYYSFIRHLRPRRVVEIGSGYSTLVAAACAQKLEQEGEAAPHLTAIEPFPSPFLRAGFPGLSRLIEEKVQDVDLGVFTSLEAGDILFIDSTHVLRAGGDVQLEYCEILPRLAPGVVVHIHDISLPKPYPRVYIEKNHYYWNEQYVLQTFLAFNSRFEVLWPGNYMMVKFPELVRRGFPSFDAMRESFPQSEPSSFWLRVRT